MTDTDTTEKEKCEAAEANPIPQAWQDQVLALGIHIGLLLYGLD